MKKLLLMALMLFSSTAWATDCERIKTWTAETLTSADLNAEFDGLITCVNSIDPDKIDLSANYSWAGTHTFSGATTFNSTITTPTTTRYYNIGPSDLVAYGTYFSASSFQNSGTSAFCANTGSAVASAALHLPSGAVITSVTVDWFRDDALAAGEASLYKNTAHTASAMATADSNSTAGDHSVTDSTISDATIDNQNNTYYLYVYLNPNDAGADVKFYKALITYTITSPLP